MLYRSGPVSRYFTWTAISFFAVAAPVSARAAYSGIALWRPEVLLLLGGLLLSSMAIAVLLAHGRRVVSLLLLAGIVLISLDLQLGGRALIEEVTEGIGYDGRSRLATKAVALLVVCGAVLAALWLSRDHLAVVLLVYSVVLAATVVSRFPFGERPEPVMASPRPASVLHLESAASPSGRAASPIAAFRGPSRSWGRTAASTATIRLTPPYPS